MPACIPRSYTQQQAAAGSQAQCRCRLHQRASRAPPREPTAGLQSNCCVYWQNYMFLAIAGKLYKILLSRQPHCRQSRACWWSDGYQGWASWSRTAYGLWRGRWRELQTGWQDPALCLWPRVSKKTEWMTAVHIYFDLHQFNNKTHASIQIWALSSP